MKNFSKINRALAAKKKLFLLTALLFASLMSFAQTPSGELFATYQKQGDRFYKGGGEADLTADHFDWNVNYYIVSCGDSMLLRATTTEERGFDIVADWQTQLRVWSGTFTDGPKSEIQVNAGDKTNRYTSICRRITPTAEDVKIHFFVSWEGNCVTNTFDFNRASINNPIVDAVAPIINPDDVTMTEVDGKLVFTFGEVTTSEPYFFYVADKNHYVGSISLENKVYITKPTVQDGSTYTFKCYAVDYNGNMSAYKEHTLAMPFDPAVDLALNKHCTAGAVQNDNTPDRAVNGNPDNFWTCFGQGSEGDWWWKVDLGNCYEITDISVHFNDCWEAYSIYSSKDHADWSSVVENEPSATGLVKEYTSLKVSGRYLKVVSAGNHLGIKEFNVYGTGLTPETPTSIDNTITSEKSVKLIEDGQVVILREGVRYNILGTRL